MADAQDEPRADENATSNAAEPMNSTLTRITIVTMAPTVEIAQNASNYFDTQFGGESNQLLSEMFGRLHLQQESALANRVFDPPSLIVHQAEMIRSQAARIVALEQRLATNLDV